MKRRALRRRYGRAEGTRREFRISGSGSEARGIEPFYVRATSPEHAAQIAVRRLYGRAVVAHRVSGTRGLSGVFQGYVSARGGGETSRGSNIHVTW